MEITQERNDNNIIVHINGRLDTTSSLQFEEQIKNVFEEADHNIELDCKEMSYISSSGLRLFLTLLKQVKSQGGALKLTHLRSEIMEIFRMTGFSKLFVFAE